MATLNFLRCTDNEFLAKHRTAVLLDDVAARRHRFAAGGDSNKDTIETLVWLRTQAGVGAAPAFDRRGR